jgi:hypothetical protein
MSYTFVKIKDTHYNIDYPWILECNNIETLMEHTEKYMGTTIEKGVKDWFDINKNSTTTKDGYRYVPHMTTYWCSHVKTLMDINGSSFIEQSTKLENQVFQGKLKQLFNGKTLYLREFGSYMVDSDSHVITNKIVTDKMVYPEYSEKDITIKQWSGGTHYYAKIGNMDVVDEDGNQKWDTYDEAYQKALEELKTLT